MTQRAAALRGRVRDVEHVEEVMAAPSPGVVEEFGNISGDLIILGAGGKIGPTLARLAKRAAPGKRIVAVARFSEQGLREQLVSCGIECITADLLDRKQVEALPKLANAVFMAGRKVGSAGREELTWAMNAYVPALVADAFAGSRIVGHSPRRVEPYLHLPPWRAAAKT